MVRASRARTETKYLHTTQQIEEADLAPILMIVADRNSDDTWTVQGQFKFQGVTDKIELSKDKDIIGIKCTKFEQIPGAIKSYIDYLEVNKDFQNKSIDELRVEVFIPILNLDCSFDYWAMYCDETLNISLVKDYKLLLRSSERVRGRKRNSRISSLKKGWRKLDVFVKSKCQEIVKSTLTENIKDTKVSNIIRIFQDRQISNWKKLEYFMKNCSSLWAIRLIGSLPKDKSERMNFFGSIFGSGIPIVFWNWESIPPQVPFESEFQKCLCRDNLCKRCRGLLKQTWELRSESWGANNEEDRKKETGYYLGMLLEDPKILPEDDPLQTIGA